MPTKKIKEEYINLLKQKEQDIQQECAQCVYLSKSIQDKLTQVTQNPELIKSITCDYQIHNILFDFSCLSTHKSIDDGACYMYSLESLNAFLYLCQLNNIEIKVQFFWEAPEISKDSSAQELLKYTQLDYIKITKANAKKRKKNIYITKQDRTESYKRQKLYNQSKKSLK